MVIMELEGCSPQLYQLVAPLVMDKEVLKSNNNYPYKTGDEYLWFVATGPNEVLGFVPVEIKKKSAIINNYYVANDDTAVLQALISQVIASLGTDYMLESVSHTHHTKFFEQNGFSVKFYWKKYTKMKYAPHGKERL